MTFGSSVVTTKSINRQAQSSFGKTGNSVGQTYQAVSSTKLTSVTDDQTIGDSTKETATNATSRLSGTKHLSGITVTLTGETFDTTIAKFSTTRATGDV
jgi:hypothetical protein